MALKFEKLTRACIRKTQPGNKLYEHGITFERLSNGDGRYTVNIMVDGVRIHRVIGKESEGVTRKQAEDFIEQARTEARKGRLKLPKGRKVVLGLREAAKKYLTKLASEGGKDLYMKKFRFEGHLQPFFKDKPIAKITAYDIERYKKYRQDEGAKPGTINRELSALSHLYTMAIEWNWIAHKPFAIKKFKEDRGRIVYLTLEQIERLLEAAKQDQNEHIHPFIVIGLATSMRKMEILSIRLEHIDVSRRVIYIPQAKTGAREQPMTKRLANLLKGLIKAAATDQEWLFPSLASRTGHTVSIEKPFRRVVKKAGLNEREVVRHTLRHTAITHLVQAGVDLPTVQRISGHKSFDMVVKYSHQNGKHIDSAMDKLEKRYEISNA
ncbi:tyrosine-type recombinase/integrase [Desulfosediminicola ganghwensis]|uniref:tyrosine-type recombinase/integrase n=1 Tax=Desulfosediminicola ganghwensis TaxID=2569540 RepID=UPI0010AB7560|nr:site-specific integrase [Desulfosediminicola ganghwensis]